MPSQQVEVAEAIAGIKRALKREREGTITFSRLFPLNSAGTNGAPPESAPSDQPVVAASNRGNKLQQGAKFVHEGSLTYLSGSEVYREVRTYVGGRAARTRQKLIRMRRRSIMPALRDISSREIRADTMNTVRNWKIVKQMRRQMQMPQTRMPTAAFAWKVSTFWTLKTTQHC